MGHSRGQSYKASTLVNQLWLKSRKYKQFPSKYDSRVVIYERKMFMRLATGLFFFSFFFSKVNIKYVHY